MGFARGWSIKVHMGTIDQEKEEGRSIVAKYRLLVNTTYWAVSIVRTEWDDYSKNCRMVTIIHSHRCWKCALETLLYIYI